MDIPKITHELEQLVEVRANRAATQALVESLADQILVLEAQRAARQAEVVALDGLIVHERVYVDKLIDATTTGEESEDPTLDANNPPAPQPDVLLGSPPRSPEQFLVPSTHSPQ